MKSARRRLTWTSAAQVFEARMEMLAGRRTHVERALQSPGDAREERMTRKQLVKLLHAYRSTAKHSLQSRSYETQQRAKGRLQLIERLLTKLEVRRVKQET